MADLSREIKRGVAALAGSAARILFPPLCGGCRTIVSIPGSLCGACWSELRLIERPWCEILGTPFQYDMGDGAVSPAAIADPPAFDRARSAVSYTGVARRMAQALKFNDRTDLAPWMAVWMLRAGRELIAEADIVVPVPLHRRRFLWRRFNQSAELGRAVAAAARLRFEPELVTRHRNTRRQVGLARNDRDENVRGAFVVEKKARNVVRDRRILVVDDVFTTGATVSAVARSLRRAGAGGVDVLTFARVLSEDFLDAESDPI
ncbi:ComF family protein [Aquibium microcysteis]|uniref:ComF family protein n=1 Tax=Aquibium microcysteis TaxID=675281 RepID=UPI00165D236B|nr:ComF family protein [Aquibium microcysteis]